MMPSPATDGLSTGRDDETTAAASPFVRWFRRLMWLGIAANVAVAIVGLGWPAAVLDLLDLEPAQPLVWPRFAAFLLILLSGFYIPSAMNPLRYTYSAIGAVLARFGGFSFFSLAGGGYMLFGLFDLFFGLPQAVLLLLAWRRRRSF
jgi:hypothetical protein